MLQREYFKQGKLEQFRQILEEGSSPGNLATLFLFITCFWCLIFVLWSNVGGVVVCIGAEIDEYYADVRYERIAILNALGAYYSYLGKIETKQREKEEHFILATQFYNKASRIDIHEPSTWVGKGRYC